MQAQTVAKPKTTLGAFDLNRMKAAVHANRKKLPKGLSREEKRKLLSEK